jgi:hypothetical protein
MKIKVKIGSAIHKGREMKKWRAIKRSCSGEEYIAKCQDSSIILIENLLRLN